jgi:UDP-N-acetylmuramoyl-L-alanyl-D-glutamate--2,6-diaminopimelate ligase
MLAKIKDFVKGVLTKERLRKLRPFYHGPRAWAAAARYGFPGRKLKLIGITGTKGKTTTTVFLGRLLNLNGQKTGYISSAVINSGDFKIDKLESGFTSDGEVLNKHKMSTIDAFEMQKLLHEMVENDCKYVVLELTSQGLEAGRHFGLGGFNLTMFLNIFPEHIDAHGGYENYKKAKAILPQNLRLNGVFVGDVDSNALDFMLESIEERKDIKRVLIDFKNSNRTPKDLQEFKFNELEKFDIRQSVEGYQILNYLGKSVETNFLAKFDAMNLGFAWVSMLQLGLKPDLLKLSQVWGVPGRMEWVVRKGQVVYRSSEKQAVAANFKNLSIMVDYAHETESLRQLLETLDRLRKSGDFDKIIHIFSVTGSGRDVWKRPQMARVTAEFSDVVVYTSEDHDIKDDLEAMQNEVVEYLRQSRAKKVEIELDRFKSFQRALEVAINDFKDQKILIVSTAMGSQQGMETAQGVIPWDEREQWIKAINLM